MKNEEKYEDWYEFWEKKSKEEIMNHYYQCVINGQALLDRIERAKKYINNCNFDSKEILKILDGEK